MLYGNISIIFVFCPHLYVMKREITDDYEQ